MAVMERAQPRTFNYYFEVLPVTDLFTDARYQREVSPFVKRIVKNFNPALVGCLIVSERGDGTFAIIDGQTRWLALQELNVTHIPCLIYEDLDAEQEARLFALFQTERKAMTAYDRFRAELFSGDPRAVAIDKLVKRCGYGLGRSTQAKGINAIRGLEIAYDAFGPVALDAMLKGFKRAYPNAKPESAQIRGFTQLIYELTDEGGFDADRYVKALGDDITKLKVETARLGEGVYSSGSMYMYAYQALKVRYQNAS